MAPSAPAKVIATDYKFDYKAPFEPYKTKWSPYQQKKRLSTVIPSAVERRRNSYSRSNSTDSSISKDPEGTPSGIGQRKSRYKA